MSTSDVSLDDIPAESVAVLLSKIQSELSEIAGLVEAIEPVLTAATASAVTPSGPDVRALQGIDLAIQKTRGLADFLAELCSGMPQDWLIDMTTALNVLKLTEMQSRLHPSQPQCNGEGLAKAVGDLDLF
jgi:hypothetical protein